MLTSSNFHFLIPHFLPRKNNQHNIYKGQPFLEVMAEMNRKAEEKRMVMKMRQTDHERKRATEKAVKAKAEEEQQKREAEEKRAAELGSDDEKSLDSNGFKKKHVPKIEKLDIKGLELETNKSQKENSRRKLKPRILSDEDEAELRSKKEQVLYRFAYSIVHA